MGLPKGKGLVWGGYRNIPVYGKLHGNWNEQARVEDFLDVVGLKK